MAEHETKTDDHHEELHAPPGNAKYWLVCGALLILTVCSFAIGNLDFFMATPAVGWTGMMTVSCAKAMLVILFFMHLKWEANWKYVLTIPASMMSIFLLLMLVPDIGMRTYHYTQARWLHAAVPHETDLEETDHGHEQGGASESTEMGSHPD